MKPGYGKIDGFRILKIYYFCYLRNEFKPLKSMADILEKKHTYTDYRNLDVDDDFIYELINGELVQKNAPRPLHQRIVRKLLVAMNAHVEANKLGEVFCAPVDVFLDEYNCPQPDLVFVSHAKKDTVTDDGIMAPPDLIVEIISPSSVKRDRTDKMKLYRKHRIAEYWLVDPNNTSVEIYTYAENDYDIHDFAAESGTVASKVLAGFSLNIQDIFGT